MAKRLRPPADSQGVFDFRLGNAFFQRMRDEASMAMAFRPNPPTPEEFIEQRRRGLKEAAEDKKRRG